jgi:O-methyltransferase
MKSLLKNIISGIGYQVTRKPEKRAAIALKEDSGRYKVDGFEFDVISPYGTYAPWLQDADFMRTYSTIKNNTLVDIYRCYELWQIAETIHNLDNTTSFVEIGVWRGGTAAIVARKLNLLNASNTFYLADTFSGVVKASDKDLTYIGGEHADTTVGMVKNLLDNTYQHIKILEGIFPNETAQLIGPTEKFAFCHIDVDVYRSAKDIVDWIWDKLIVGGIIVFDDYGFSNCTGIIRYVNEQKNMTDRIVLYNLNGHAILVKLK